MLTRDGWENFESSAGWQEVLATVKERMKLINQDLLSPGTFKGLSTDEKNEKRAELQLEFSTCLWFINLPKYDAVNEEKADEGDKQDHTVAPDLESFRK